MKIKKHKTYFATLIGYFLLVTVVYFVTAISSKDKWPDYSAGRVQRVLLQLTNCTPRSVEEFPPDFMTRQQKQQGGVVFHIFISMYMFMALAIICDEYFVSSLERICEVLHLKHDIAGATFMAAGSSAPELFTSIIGVFITNSDVGVSTIVGSAVFNILCIVALCGICTSGIIQLTWWPLFRDALFYCITVVVLVVEIMDGLIYWYEALIMLLLYAVYIILLYHNDKIQMFVTKHLTCFTRFTQYSEYTTLTSSNNGITTMGLLGSSDDEEIMETGDVDSNHSKIRIEDEASSVGLEFSSPFDVPESFLHRLYWIFMLPVTVLCYITIPDCRRPGCWQRLFFATFAISIVWIAGVSYILVWMVCITGDTLGIPDTVMGLTLLAAGTSIPDALSSVLVSRDGYGDMAVSNCIGSNIFDILLCLGLPWLVRTGMMHPGSVVQITSSGLTYTSITLFSTVIVLVLALMINHWRLTRKLGIAFLLFYVAVIAVSCLYELNIFGNFVLPPCPRTRL